MKLKDTYIKTYKECPIEVDYGGMKILYRSGFLKYNENSNYSYTPIGSLFFNRITDYINNNFKNFLDIFNNCEDILDLYINDLKSYKELPLNIRYKYKENNKEYKLRSGLFNSKNENILRLISIDSIDNIKNTYNEINLKIEELLNNINIKYNKTLNSELNTKYIYLSNNPLKDIILCDKCGYLEVKEDAISTSELDLSTEDIKLKEEIYTPNIGKIQDLEEFLNVPQDKLIKTLLFKINEHIIAVLLRGDRNINIDLLANYIGVNKEDINMASEDDVKKVTNAEIGFAGPINLNHIKSIYCDEEVISIKNAVVGANKTNYHIKNVNYNVDFKADYIGNFKEVNKGHKCIKCSEELDIVQGTSIVDLNIIKQNKKYLDSNGKEQNLYTLDVRFYLDKLFLCIAQENKDEIGIKWPSEISYFDYEVIIGNIKDENQNKVANDIYEILLNKGYKVLLDDRNERIGSKFKDSELIGIPNIVVIGKDIEDNIIEIRNTSNREKKKINLQNDMLF